MRPINCSVGRGVLGFAHRYWFWERSSSVQESEVLVTWSWPPFLYGAVEMALDSLPQFASFCGVPMTNDAAHSAPRLSVSASRNTLAPAFATACLLIPSSSMPLSPLIITQPFRVASAIHSEYGAPGR